MADIDTGFAEFDVPATAVTNEIDAMNGRAQAALDHALSAIGDLGRIELPKESPSPPGFAIPDIFIPSAVAPAPPSSSNLFGVIEPFADQGFEDLGIVSGVDDSLLLNPGTFISKVGDPHFPDDPGDIDTSGEPAALGAPTPITIPTASLPDIPTMDALTPIVIPTFAGITEPTFTDSDPGMGATNLSGLGYTEPHYTPTVDVASVITRIFNGGMGLTAAVQSALFDAARAREDQTGLAAEEEAFDTFAARGFGIPPGMLVEAVSVAQQNSRLAVNGLERDILTKAAQWQLDMLKTAIAEGVMYEGNLLTAFTAMANRTLEASKAQLEIDMRGVDVAIAVFNAKQQARQINATVFKTRWEGEATKVSAFKAQIDAQAAIGQVNEQLVRIYVAKYQGLETAARVFSEEMRGAQIHSEIEKNRTENYANAVKAWGMLLEARKTPLQVYSEKMKGEAVRVSAQEAEIRGFAETVRAQESEANVKIKFIELKISAAQASIAKYTARLQSQRDHVQAELASIQAHTGVYSSEINRYSVELQGENQARAQEIQIAEIRLRNDLAFYETQLREFDAGLDRQLKRAGIIAESLKSAGSIAASLAAGAMSSIHVQAAIHGQGSVGYANNQNHNYQHRVA